MTLTDLALPPVPAVALTASVSTEGTAAVVTLAGEADLFTFPVVVAGLTRAIGQHDGPVIVDLGSTEFVDSGTVRALERARQFLANRGRTLTLRSPSKMAVRIIELLDLGHLIESER